MKVSEHNTIKNTYNTDEPKELQIKNKIPEEKQVKKAPNIDEKFKTEAEKTIGNTINITV